MCDGYLSPEGECVTPTFPILELPGDAVIVHPTSTITELPNTGTDIDPFLWGAVIVLVGVVLFALAKFFERRP